MLRRLAAGVAAVICLVALPGLAAPAQEDLFIKQRDEEAVRSGITGFSISFADNRQRFRPGEAIKLTFRFDNLAVSPFNWEGCHRGMGVAKAVLDHTDGATDPEADLWDSVVDEVPCGSLSGVVGAFSPGKPHRVTITVYLNQSFRFDRAGKYRLYIRSWHTLRHEEPPLISNILEFEVLERDPEWEVSTLEEAIKVLDSSSDAAARKDAARAISYLATAAAAEEMARRFNRRPPRRDGSADRDSDLQTHWVRGLYGSRERERVIAEMERELDRPDRYVSWGYVRHLALLALTLETVARPIERSRYESRFRVYSTRRLRTIKAAGSLVDHLQHAFRSTAGRDESKLEWETLTAAFPDFPQEVEQAFATLNAEDQRKVLMAYRNWTVFHDPAFIPMLRRLSGTTGRQGPQDIALRLLYDLAPAEGRQIALQELAKTDSAVGIAGVSILPDRELPDLDQGFVQALEHASTAQEYGRAMERIERFATGRMIGRIRRAYERFEGARTCKLAPVALAYFFRVAPGYAQAEAGKVMEAVYQGEQCDAGVLPAIAARRMSPALEETAIRHLSNANGWVVADAARMLKQHGSARAETPLWRALERWHKRWKGRAAELEADERDPDGMPWDAALERELTEALMDGISWLPNEDFGQRLASLCVSEDRRESILRDFDQKGTPAIVLAPSPLPRGEPSFFASGHTSTRLSSRHALRLWLSLHPRGTTFTWKDQGWTAIKKPWLPGEEPRYFEETRRFLENRGMRLIRTGW